jgi:hypothetical protein
MTNHSATVAASDPNVCRLTLVGPASKRTERPSPLKLQIHNPPQWRRLVLELRVGSERCPDWDHADLCITAIQDLVKLADGYMSDEVVTALTTHMEVVSYETFRGPPRR